MSEKGSVQVALFIVGILFISGIIVGGSFYIKNHHPELIEKANTVPNNQTIPNKPSLPTPNSLITPSLITPTIVVSSPYPTATVSGTASEEQKVVLKVIEAMKNEDWATLYTLVPATFAGGSQQVFVETMKKQQPEIGRIVDMQLLSQPVVTTSPQGIKNFTVKTRVTYLKNGTRSSVNYTDYYLWENGKWKLWFSDDKN